MVYPAAAFSPGDKVECVRGFYYGETGTFVPKSGFMSAIVAIQSGTKTVRARSIWKIAVDSPDSPKTISRTVPETEASLPAPVSSANATEHTQSVTVVFESEDTLRNFIRSEVHAAIRMEVRAAIKDALSPTVNNGTTST